MKKLTAIFLSLILVFSLCSTALAAEETKPFENSEFYCVGDYTLHYRVYESPNSEKQVMLLHGFGLSTASFEGLAENYVSEGYSVVLVDLPNFGYSSRETTKMNLQNREDLVASLMQKLGGKWILGGHSMGGGVAINIATMYSDLVSALVLFAPQTNSAVSPVMATIMKSPAIRGLYNVLISFAAKTPALMRMMVEMSFSDAEYAKKYDLSRISDPLKIKGTGSGMAIMSSHTVAPNFEKLSLLEIPCIVVTASDDKVASQENLEAIIASCPEGTKTYNFEKGGHMMMEYDSALACEVTLEILQAA